LHALRCMARVIGNDLPCLIVVLPQYSAPADRPFRRVSDIFCYMTSGDARACFLYIVSCVMIDHYVAFSSFCHCRGVTKDHLDAQERKQEKSTLETPVDFEEEILDAEVQENEAIPLSDEEIAHDAASSEGSMSGSGSRRRGC
ncbi:hypothetical protein Tco_0074325, partial [Tanacetum coccineum]